MIDPSVFIARGAIVLGDVDLGKDVSVWYNAVIRGDTDKITIGAETNIQDLTMIHADPGVPCMVGKRVTVGHRVILHGCTIEDDCLIGMGAIVLNKVHVGRGSVIGAGALLLEGTEVPPGSLFVGIAGPGRYARSTRRCASGSSTAGGIMSTRPGAIVRASCRSSRRRQSSDRSFRRSGPRV